MSVAIPQALGIGVFDHLDRSARPLNEYYEERLKIVEAYDAAGIEGYFVAEHHATPLGMAPSPGIFLSAVAQRTRRLRFGPMVYLLPFYHPIRLAEEIAMLDQLSNGRYEPGLGLGISPIEAMLYGLDHTKFREIFAETVAILKLALSQDRVNFDGTHHHFHDVRMEVHPFQKPYPPFWYGISSIESADICAGHGFNALTAAQPARTQEIGARFRAAAANAGLPGLRFGFNRFVVVGETDEQALVVARRAFPIWQENFSFLYHAYGRSPVQGERPTHFDGMAEIGLAVAGAPATVLAMLRDQLEASGANTLVVQLVFGDMSLEESLRSIDLFVREVVPVLRREARPE